MLMQRRKREQGFAKEKKKKIKIKKKKEMGISFFADYHIPIYIKYISQIKKNLDFVLYFCRSGIKMIQMLRVIINLSFKNRTFLKWLHYCNLIIIIMEINFRSKCLFSLD